MDKHVVVSPAIDGCRVREVECKSVLNKSGLSDYAVNCYGGCGHGCIYCYARFATRFSHPGEPWGSFLDVKVNAPHVLEREAQRKKPGSVILSSVCDGWQPREADYNLTRQCLEILLHYRFSVSILTKNSLARRDLALIASPDAGVEFGMTITTLDEALCRIIEPGASPPVERLDLLQEAGRKGIRTYAFLGPLIPGLSDSEDNLDRLFKATKETRVEYFYVDRLNPRFGVWRSLKGVLEKHYPHLVNACRKILYDRKSREEYTERLTASISRLARKHELESKMKLCF